MEFHLDPITCALHGGEDYELLFTVDPKDLEKVRYMDSVYIIGEITKKEDADRVFEFIAELGRQLQKETHLTEDNCPELVLLRFGAK